MRRLLITLLSIGIYGTAAAQEPTPLSLQQAIDYALQNNNNMKNARIDVLIQEAQVKQTTAAALPKLNGKAEFTQNIVPMYTFFPAGLFPMPGLPTTGFIGVPISPNYTTNASISGSQILFDGSVMVALQARKAVMEFANRRADMTEQDVRYNVYKAYYSLVVAYRQFEITKNSLQYARIIEQDIITTQKSGFAEKIDVDRTSVQVNNLVTDSLRTANILAVSEQMLKYQMGMDINTPIVLTDNNIETYKDESLMLLESAKEYERVPSFNLAKSQLTLNEYDLKRYKLAALPTLNLISSGGYNYADNELREMFKTDKYKPSLFYMLQLNVPIFNGFMRTNQVREAKLKIEKAKNDIEYTKLSIDFQSAQSRSTLRNSLLQAESQKRNLELSNSVLDLAQRKYKAGVGSNLEVTQAQTDQLKAQNNYFMALLEVINSQADLKKALGLLK